MIFEDRRDAGRKLAEKLSNYSSPETIVLAIPRGGVVVGAEVAGALQVPLDVIVPRKIGAPGEREFAIGAIAGEDVRLLDEQTITMLRVSEKYIEHEIREQRAEIVRRRKLYRGDRPVPSLEGKTVLLIDDGIATGYTTIAAAREIRKANPAKLVLAVPVAPRDTVARLKLEVDDLVVLETPEPFSAVGYWYLSFEQTTDEEVIELLKQEIRERARSTFGKFQDGATDVSENHDDYLPDAFS